MRIAFDSNIFTTQKYGGVSRYLVRLGEEFARMGHQIDIHGFLHVNRHLAEASPSLTRMRMIDHFPPLTRRITHLANDLWADRQLNQNPPDLIHESYCHNRQVGGGNLPRVCTVHDMIHELFPQYIGKMDRTAEYRLRTIQRADAIICVSESTRRDLLRLTGINPDKTHVVHHGFKNESAAGNLNGSERQILEKLTAKPFLLYVGGREGYKNFQGFLKGYSRSAAKGTVSIVAFGGGGFTSLELEYAESLGIKPTSLLQSGGSDRLLHELYRKTEAFIYPSLYEGFGFPPLEAMSEDCPVLSSNASCMPEVIGDAALFFDPTDDIMISCAIDQVLNSKDQRNSLIQKGRQRLNEFSWEKCANQTMRIYQSVAGC